MTIEKSQDIMLLSKMFKELMEDERSDMPKTDAQIFSCLKSFLENTDAAFVFKEAGIVVGYALVILDKNPVYLRHFYICRDHRRKGYGTTAFNLLVKTLNTTTMDLDVFSWNERGKAFWTSLGFAPRTIVMRYQKKC